MRSAVGVLFVAMAATLGLVGCSSGDSESGASAADNASEGALRTMVPAMNFKLRSDPRAAPNPECDRYTEFTLSTNGTAQLTNKLGGTCELFVGADARTYHVKRLADDCGSRIYAGTAAGDAASSIKITDNRTRTCENMIAATIVVEESRGGADSSLYWSFGTN